MSLRAGPVRVALLAFAASLAGLLANGRAIGSGDTNALEKTAASIVTRGTVVLPDEGATDPFTRATPGGRISIYPALPAFLASPFFFLFGLVFDLDSFGLQIAGKLTAAFLAASATALLAWSFAMRSPPGRALASALLFSLATSVSSTAQALWQHPAVALFLAMALIAMERLETSDKERRLRPGLIAALGLSLAAASRPAVIPMCAVLLLFLVSTNRAHAGRLLLAASVPATLVALYNTTFFGAPWHFGPAMSGRFLATFPESIAGLLVSPGRGLFVFTPLALLALRGLLSRVRGSVLAGGLLAAVITHFAFMTTWNEWHGGESFGPRLLTDLLPALFFFLPETLASWPKAGAVLGLASLFVQLLGGWTYDYRFERLHQRGQDFETALWSWRDSPLAFAVREGVLIQGHPDLEGRRLRLRLRRSVPFGPDGSSIEGLPASLRVSGTPLVRDIRLERGARTSPLGIMLSHPGDALAFRFTAGGALVLHLTGSLQGTLRVEVGEESTSTVQSGPFVVALPIQARAGGDVFVRAESGELGLARVEVR